MIQTVTVNNNSVSSCCKRRGVAFRLKTKVVNWLNV